MNRSVLGVGIQREVTVEMDAWNGLMIKLEKSVNAK